MKHNWSQMRDELSSIGVLDISQKIEARHTKRAIKFSSERFLAKNRNELYMAFPHLLNIEPNKDVLSNFQIEDALAVFYYLPPTQFYGNMSVNVRAFAVDLTTGKFGYGIHLTMQHDMSKFTSNFVKEISQKAIDVYYTWMWDELFCIREGEVLITHPIRFIRTGLDYQFVKKVFECHAMINGWCRWHREHEHYTDEEYYLMMEKHGKLPYHTITPVTQSFLP